MDSRGQPPRKLERKTVEKNRRIHMKSLCFKLASLIPNSHCPKSMSTQQDHLEKATIYIKKLKQSVKELKARRDAAMGIQGFDAQIRGQGMEGIMLPRVQVRDLGANLEVVVIGGPCERFKLSEMVHVLEEEGLAVANASTNALADKIIHVLHLQVTSSRIGFESATVAQRLNELLLWR